MTEEQAAKICGACSVPPEELEIPKPLTYEQFKTGSSNPTYRTSLNDEEEAQFADEEDDVKLISN